MGEVAAAIHRPAEAEEAEAAGVVVTQPEEEEATGQPAQEEAEGAEPSGGAEEAR